MNNSKKLEMDEKDVYKCIVKECLKNTKTLKFISENYENNFIEDSNYNLITNILIKYYKENGKHPHLNILVSIIKEYITQSKLEVELKIISSILKLSLKYEYTDIDFVNNNIEHFIKCCTIHDTVMSSLNTLTERDDKMSEIFNSFEKCRKISINEKDLGLDYFGDLDIQLEKLNEPNEKIPTLLTDLDVALEGGIPKNGKCLLNFAARAGVGKSIMLTNLAVNFVKQNLNVVIITCEMSQDAYAQRLHANFANFNINKLKNNITHIKNKIENIKHGKLKVKEFPPATICAKDIEFYLNEIQDNQNFNVDVIIVDYLGLLIPNNPTKSSNTFEKLGDVAKELRALSYIFKSPVISAVQFNRSVEKNSSGDQSNIAESDKINSDSDFIMSLYKKEEVGDKLFGKVIKSRFGATDMIIILLLERQKLLVIKIKIKNLN